MPEEGLIKIGRIIFFPLSDNTIIRPISYLTSGRPWRIL